MVFGGAQAGASHPERIPALSTAFAVANNLLSVQVGESVARDLREALFRKIQSFSFGDLDRLKTDQLLVRLTSGGPAPHPGHAAHRHPRPAAHPR
jgi:ABC-type multidrug transport system fused ATPase/permease subunit